MIQSHDDMMKPGQVHTRDIAPHRRVGVPNTKHNRALAKLHNFNTAIQAIDKHSPVGNLIGADAYEKYFPVPYERKSPNRGLSRVALSIELPIPFPPVLEKLALRDPILTEYELSTQQRLILTKLMRAKVLGFEIVSLEYAKTQLKPLSEP